MTIDALKPIQTSEIFGVDVYIGEVGSAADAVIARARSRKGGYACLCNVHVLMTSQQDASLAQALRGAWMVFPDGAPLAWLQRRGGAPDARRVAGTDLMAEVLMRGRVSGLRHYLYGSTPQVTACVASVLEMRTPGAVVGAESPPFASVGALRPSAQLLDASPDVIWCALGAPKQELWMHRFAEQVAPAVVLGVGAAFDFISGRFRRAPQWMQRSGFEWLHRLCHDPQRLSGRYLKTNAIFAMRLVANPKPVVTEVTVNPRGAD